MEYSHVTPLGSPVAEELADGDGLTVADGLGLGLTVADGLGLGLTVADELGLGDVVTLPLPLSGYTAIIASIMPCCVTVQELRSNTPNP